jgi:uncharacterized protein YodC (DUF2158 family)
MESKTVSKTYNLYEDFEVGDIVRLKSGGPNMTVENASGTKIECAWFLNDILHKGFCDQASLERVPTKDPDLSPA